MDSHLRTVVKAFSYRTAVGLSIFLAALAMNYSAGFGLTFVILSYTIGFASFWVQERIWNIFKWGKIDGYDLQRRSIAKTITWRIWSFFILAALGSAMGLSAEAAVEWSIVTNILFLVVHYVHERVWNRFNWGKLPVLST
jgi:uncharacterized membrane protein